MTAQGLREGSALMGLPRSRFARMQAWLQLGKYVSALVSDLLSTWWSRCPDLGVDARVVCGRALVRSHGARPFR